MCAVDSVIDYDAGPIPESLGQLTNLTRLDLSCNKLSGKISSLAPSSCRPCLVSLKSADRLIVAKLQFYGFCTPSETFFSMFPPISGDLPLSVVRLFSSSQLTDEFSPGDKNLRLKNSGPGFTLPADISDLDPAISKLDLCCCNLSGFSFSKNRELAIFVSFTSNIPTNTLCFYTG